MLPRMLESVRQIAISHSYLCDPVDIVVGISGHAVVTILHHENGRRSLTSRLAIFCYQVPSFSI